jgi:hypothetical protein
MTFFDICTISHRWSRTFLVLLLLGSSQANAGLDTQAASAVKSGTGETRLVNERIETSAGWITVERYGSGAIAFHWTMAFLSPPGAQRRSLS